MIESLADLPLRERRGSRARCILLTEGSKPEVAERLTALVAPYAAVSAERHWWAPRSFADPAEAKLGDAEAFLPAALRSTLVDWWLAVRHSHANTPNWDIVSQATIEGRDGLLLVEAKAHDAELKVDGKEIGCDATDRSAANHQRITNAVADAQSGLSGVLPGWGLTIRSHYQLANRFAWSWKIATLGVPVVLVYLGFLRAEEMCRQGAPFRDETNWDQVMRGHASQVVPGEAWEHRLDIGGGGSVRPLIRSTEVSIA